MKQFLILLPFFFFPILAVPCINEYEKIPGVLIESQENVELLIRMPVIDEKKLDEFIAKREKINATNKLSFQAADLVAAYLYKKDFKKALALSEKLYAMYPDKYNVVMNYAVSLELNAQYEEALVMLRKAIKINPNSHNGSEWMHEKILEFVITGSKDYSKSILGFDFGQDAKPVSKNRSSSVGSDMMGLEYQLNERIYFVKKPDPLFGSMLFDLGNLAILGKWEFFAQGIFDQATEYGYKSPLLTKRKEYAKNLEESHFTSEEKSDTNVTLSSKNNISSVKITPSNQSKPDTKPGSIFETIKYNRALVIIGFVSVFLIVGGFAYLLVQKKKS